MKVSEAISRLEEIRKEHGDVEILLDTDVEYGDLDGSYIPVAGVKVTDVSVDSESDSDELEQQTVVVLEFSETHTHERD